MEINSAPGGASAASAARLKFTRLQVERAPRALPGWDLLGSRWSERRTLPGGDYLGSWWSERCEHCQVEIYSLQVERALPGEDLLGSRWSERC